MRPRLERGFAALLLILITAVFVGANAHLLKSPFGDSNDGRNGAVWALGSRSLRHNGPIASGLGGRRDFGYGKTFSYADHPPLIYMEAALAEALGGERPWTTRAPAWLGTVATIFFLFLLLEEFGLTPLAGAAGVAFGVGCPMIGVNGAMLDSWVIGLPFSTLSLLLWTRQTRGRPVPRWALVAVTALTVLSSWLGLLVTGGIIAFDRLRRPRSTDAADDTRLLTAVIALAAVLTWVTWVDGGLSHLLDASLNRSGHGGSSAPWSAIAQSVTGWWGDVFTTAQLVAGIPLVALAIWHRRTRAVSIVLVVSIVVWFIAFPTGAEFHDYWGLWIVLPLAIGAGVAVDEVRHRVPSGGGLATVVLAFLALVLAVTGIAGPSRARATRDRGIAAALPLVHARYSPGQRTGWYVGTNTPPVDWITYNSHRPAMPLLVAADIRRLSGSDPQALVFVEGPYLDKELAHLDPTAPCGSPSGHTFFLTSASELASRLDDRCPPLTGG